jgi:SAM-dependent methyltransferase
MTKTNARVRDVLRRRIPEKWKVQLNRWIGANTWVRLVMRRLLENRKDLDVIRGELKCGSRPWRNFCSGLSTVGSTERVVEIPWVLSRWKGEKRVLDIGTAFGLPLYMHELLRLGASELHGVDVALVKIDGVKMTQADVRNMPFPDSWFELVTCISTLEHIGLEDPFGTPLAGETPGDVAALKEMARVLAKGGRILVTVPFGKLEHLRFMKQYDLNEWDASIQRSGLEVVELDFYGYSASGWRRAESPSELLSNTYQGIGAPAGTGVLCAALTA